MKKFGPISLGVRYLHYLLTSFGRHRIHSPFVYRLYTEVIKSAEKLKDVKIRAVLDQRYRQRDEISYNHPLGHKLISTSIGNIARQSSKNRKYRNLLYRIARNHHIETGLEIGTSLGFSTMFLSAAKPDARWFTLEGAAPVAELARDGFKKAGLTNIQVIEGNFDNTLPEILDKAPLLDFVYFDGNHQYQPTMDYFELCLDRKNEHSIFVFDDINWSPGMKQAWKDIKNHPEVITTIDLFMFGLVYFDPSRTREHFVLRY